MIQMLAKHHIIIIFQDMESGDLELARVITGGHFLSGTWFLYSYKKG